MKSKKIIQFPSKQEFRIEFMIDDEISMRGSSQNIHWKIEHNYGIAKVQARTRKQAKVGRRNPITNCDFPPLQI